MSLWCAPKRTLSVCHVRVFSTRPLLFHIELASLAAKEDFFFFLPGLNNVSRKPGVKRREKGENLNANANRCLIQHTVWRENDVSPQVFCHIAMKFPSMIIYTFVFVRTPPRSCVIPH